MTFSRPIRLRLSRAALCHNYQRAKTAAPTARAWAVIKANAYGHGQAFAVAALADRADGFAVLEPETAVQLRAQGIQQPLLLLEGVFRPADAAWVHQHRIDCVVHRLEQLDWLLAGLDGGPLSVYLKLNTGMNRLGLGATELAIARQRLAAHPQVAVTLMTHFADADGPGGVGEQFTRFQAMTAGWSAPVSLANSATILRHPAAHGDWVRPGIMLYGASPFADCSAAHLDLRPVMTLESQVIAVQTLAAGERVGYGGTFVAERSMRIGIVAGGYADGYPRHAPTGTPIAVGGQRTRTVGRVSMDMLAVDLTDLAATEVGSPVTLWGNGPGGDVPADAVAAAAGTIAYELFCAVAPRVPVTVDD